MLSDIYCLQDKLYVRRITSLHLPPSQTSTALHPELTLDINLFIKLHNKTKENFEFFGNKSEKEQKKHRMSIDVKHNIAKFIRAPFPIQPRAFL